MPTGNGEHPDAYGIYLLEWRADIWGEMAPETFPVVDGKAFIVMKREGMIHRSFDTQFVLKWHEALNPYFEIVRELSEEEVTIWMQKAEQEGNKE